MHLKTLCEAAWTGLRRPSPPKFVFICIADHFEPDWKNASYETQIERVAIWTRSYPQLFGSHTDSRGRCPQHTFFYPIEVYDARHIENLCRLVRGGYADIEIHLHHDNDCESRLTDLLETSRDCFYDSHGLLTKDQTGAIRYGFIHGNWALDNSHPDGRWCGVNNELSILVDTGCYADFTMPAAPHPAQTSTINSIYYATDDPLNPKSHDRGVKAKVGLKPPEKSLLMIQGPLSISLDRQSFKTKLRVENGNLSGSQKPTQNRFAHWLRSAVCVEGRSDWTFIKLHTHGAQENNASALLSPDMQKFHRLLSERAMREQFQYFYVTAREMAQLVHQAEGGFSVPDFTALNWS